MILFLEEGMTCGGSGVLKTIKFISSLLDIIFFVVPIILTLLLSFDFFTSLISKEEDIQKKVGLFIKRILTCVILFLLPKIVTFVLTLFSSIGIEYAECVKIAKEGSDFSQYDLKIPSEYSKNSIDISTNKGKATVKVNPSSGTSSGNGKILLIAGHSFSPYCAQDPANTECRPTTLKYEEPVETRKLVQLIKSELLKIGYKNDDVDIVNELLGEDFNDSSTSKSLYIEAKIHRDELLKKIDFSQYEYAIEIHFNASTNNGGGTAKGVLTYCLDSSCGGVSEINSEIRKAVINTLNTNDAGVITSGLTNLNLLNGKVPFTYLETEYYDNDAAMDIYANNRENVAAAIAKVIKKYYP